MSTANDSEIVVIKKALRYYIGALSPYPLKAEKLTSFFGSNANASFIRDYVIFRTGDNWDPPTWLTSWVTGSWRRGYLDATISTIGATIDDLLLIEECLNSDSRAKPFIRPAFVEEYDGHSWARMDVIARYAFGGPLYALSELASAEMVSRCLPRDAYLYQNAELSDGELYFLLSDMARYVIKQSAEGHFVRPFGVWRSFGFAPLCEVGTAWWTPEDGYVWRRNNC